MKKIAFGSTLIGLVLALAHVLFVRAEVARDRAYAGSGSCAAADAARAAYLDVCDLCDLMLDTYADAHADGVAFANARAA